MGTNTPVAFFVFNRPDVTQRVFTEIRRARPNQLLIIADGPRASRLGEADRCEAVRTIVDQVDWPCEVERHYADTNLGCRARVSSGLDWVFDRVDRAIILEDDCLPDPGFFTAALAEATGLLRSEGAELHAGALPSGWQASLPTLLADLWGALPRVIRWNPAVGAELPEPGAANPYASAYLMTGILLAQVPEQAWVSPDVVEQWIVTRHPYWRGKKNHGTNHIYLLHPDHALGLQKEGCVESKLSNRSRNVPNDTRVETQSPGGIQPANRRGESRNLETRLYYVDRYLGK